MQSNNLFYRRLGIFFICGMGLISASCSMLEKQIDRTAGGPRVPADTAVSMRLEPTAPSEMEASQTVSPGPLRISILEAILLTLENNRALVVERPVPIISSAFTKSLV